MRISYSAVWEDTVRLLRTHASLAAALAGVFLLLPSLLIGYLLPTPTASDPNELLSQFREYYLSNAHWMVLSGLLSMAGTLAILALVFRRGGTVASAIAAAFGLLPFYFIATLITGVPIALGLVLFIIPGLYLLARFLPLGAVMSAEGVRNPLAAIGRTWAVTKGNGWAIAGLFVLVFVAGLILASVVAGVLSLVLRVALPDNLAAFLGLVIGSATSTALQVVMIFLYAALYRALAGGAGAAAGATQAPPSAGGGI